MSWVRLGQHEQGYPVKRGQSRSAAKASLARVEHNLL